MKMNFISFVTLVALCFVITSCENGEDISASVDIYATVNHGSNRQIIVEIYNVCDSAAEYYICSSYDGIPPSVEKKEGNDWSVYRAPICNGFGSYCCGTLPAGESYRDTLEVDFEPGYYRVSYLFIIRPNSEHEVYYSNTFQVK